MDEKGLLSVFAPDQFYFAYDCPLLRCLLPKQPPAPPPPRLRLLAPPVRTPLSWDQLEKGWNALTQPIRESMNEQTPTFIPRFRHFVPRPLQLWPRRPSHYTPPPSPFVPFGRFRSRWITRPRQHPFVPGGLVGAGLPGTPSSVLLPMKPLSDPMMTMGSEPPTASGSLSGNRDWNAIAVMDALTGRCFVQTFQPFHPFRSLENSKPLTQHLGKLVIVGEDARGGVKLGGLFWRDSKRVAAFEYDLIVQNPLELQRELTIDTKESQTAISSARSKGVVMKGPEMRRAAVEMQMAHQRMAVWPICLPPPISDRRVPFMLEPLEDVMAAHVREGIIVGNVAAYIVCDGTVHTLFNRQMQTYKLPYPASVHTISLKHPQSIRIFAPNQLKLWIASNT